MSSSTFTFGASIEGRKKALKKFRQMVCPRRRPKQVPPKKRVKWRLVSKWFKRYEKQFLIGMNIKVDSSEPGNSFISEIIDARIVKAGGHHRSFLIKSRPITVIQKPKPKESCK